MSKKYEMHIFCCSQFVKSVAMIMEPMVASALHSQLFVTNLLSPLAASSSKWWLIRDTRQATRLDLQFKNSSKILEASALQYLPSHSPICDINDEV